MRKRQEGKWIEELKEDNKDKINMEGNKPNIRRENTENRGAEGREKDKNNEKEKKSNTSRGENKKR